MSDFVRGAWALAFKLLAVLALCAALWVILAWPWIVATSNAVDHGHPKGSATYNSAGWTAELLYLTGLVVLVVLSTIGAKSRRRRRMQTPGWRHAPTDPFGMQRWWDGSFWTASTQWDFELARFDSGYFTHRGCRIRHKNRRTAALHRLASRQR